MYARHADNVVVEAFESERREAPKPLLSGFVRHAVHIPNRNGRLLGLAVVLIVHGLLVIGYVVNGPGMFARIIQRPVQVVNVAEELPEEVEPPPPPKFLPPEVYVPVLIEPEITLTSPPPPQQTITIPPPVAAPSAPEAPLGPPPPAFDPRGDAQKAFVARLFAHLNRFKQYPQGARIRREQGVVGLRFTMDRAGRVLSFAIAKGSGSKALDEEALNIIKRAEPLPRIPAAFPQTQLDLVIPVEFSLR